jgi:excisionase family DNA binding protein
MDSPKTKLLLKVTEAAELLSIARSKAYQMVQDGQLPSVRIGTSLRVPAAELNDYVAKLIRENAAQ